MCFRGCSFGVSNTPPICSRNLLLVTHFWKACVKQRRRSGLPLSRPPQSLTEQNCNGDVTQQPHTRGRRIRADGVKWTPVAPWSRTFSLASTEAFFRASLLRYCSTLSSWSGRWSIPATLWTAVATASRSVSFMVKKQLGSQHESY